MFLRPRQRPGTRHGRNPGGTLPSGCQPLDDGAHRPGQSFVDSAAGVRIDVLSTAAALTRSGSVGRERRPGDGRRPRTVILAVAGTGMVLVRRREPGRPSAS
ncbi:hypothetical protein ACFQX6_07025 [Streptosporangium lutulentum]